LCILIVVGFCKLEKEETSEEVIKGIDIVEVNMDKMLRIVEPALDSVFN
jgi:hypothetical protein